MSFETAQAIFNQADVNGDGVIDQGEFVNWAAGAAAAGAGYGGSASYGGSSSYESSASYGSGGYGAGGNVVYESASSGSGGYGAGYGASYGAGAGAGSAGYSSQTAVQTYATDAQGLYQDPNPQVIRRPAAAGVQTYTQNIKVRFLQPPPVPPPGPLIIKEVRPPQPPAPLPLRIRQQAPPLPTPPPLVLREHPPQPPPVIASQTVIRRLAGLPVPPRSVIIERLPPLPPRPRDIVIERWVPYGAQAKRRTILQRAAPAQPYPRPRNVIIQYEQSPARIVRNFQRLGVVAGSPGAYVQQYGAQLLDAGSLVSQARAAGVLEDISAPYAVGSAGFSAATYGQEVSGLGASSYESSSFTVGGGAGYSTVGYGGVEYVDDGSYSTGLTTYETGGWSSSTGLWDGGFY